MLRFGHVKVILQNWATITCIFSVKFWPRLVPRLAYITSLSRRGGGGGGGGIVMVVFTSRMNGTTKKT